MTSDGSWRDEQAMYTTFAGAAYYPFPLYSTIFPMNALSEYLESRRGNRP